MEWNIPKGKTIPRNINIISCILCIPFWFYFATNPAWLPNRCQTCSIMKRPEALSMSLKRPNILQTHHHLLGITFHRLDSCHTQRIMELEPSEDSTYIFAVVIKKIPQPKRMAIIWWKRCGTNVFLIFFLEVFFEDSRVPMVVGRCWRGWHLWPLFRGAGSGFFEHPIWFTSACRFEKYRKMIFRYFFAEFGI